MLGFGPLGIAFRLADYPLAPIVIGTILGPIVENNLRRSLLISQDGLAIFIERPISLTLLVVDVLLVIGAAAVFLRARRRRVSAES